MQKSTRSYKSDDYDRQSQRFIIPLYIKDELGNHNFSSTGTLAKYKNSHFIIFAAHALGNEITLENINTFFKDGTFHPIKQLTTNYQIFKNEDIIIAHTPNSILENKNYFNLEKEDLIGFRENKFSWTGFPVSQSSTKHIHKSKQAENLKNTFTYTNETGTYFTSSKYFTIESEIITNNEIEIIGKYNRNKQKLKYAGPVSMAPHPKGMSGGPMYFSSNNFILTNDIDDSFRFAGIGIEYKNNEKIIGVARKKIIKLLKQFLNED